VEQFEQIRRDRDREGLSVRALAVRHGVHRRAVRQALESAVPPAKRLPVGRPAPKLGPFRAVIDAWLEGDKHAPRKQRHTAKRIHRRLVDEQGADVAETTVREYVRARRRQMGLAVSEVHVPQVHAPGADGEVDWGEATVILAGVATVVHLFIMRASFSGAAFCQASLVETQQAFLELHVQAFGWFGGVFAALRYDNLGSAVKQVLKGRRRVESDRFVALRSHYLFVSQFTTPGIAGAHEKGGVEGEVGRLRRNHLVPVPEFDDLAALNAWLLECCEHDLHRRIDGRMVTIGEAFGQERGLLLKLPAERFDASETATPRVDSKSLVTVRRHRYSVPVCLAALKVHARIGAREIQLSHDGRVVATHQRLHGQPGQTSARLDHYLELLAHRPGGLEHSLALSQERERGAWPGCYDELWQKIAAKTTPSEAARQMIDVLMLVREHGAPAVELAVRGALAAGAHDGRAVAVLAARAERAAAPPLTDLDQRLTATDRPAPDLADYDQLLGRGEGTSR
jgi:transposase